VRQTEAARRGVRGRRGFPHQEPPAQSSLRDSYHRRPPRYPAINRWVLSYAPPGHWHTALPVGHWHTALPVGHWHTALPVGHWHTALPVGQWYTEGLAGQWHTEGLAEQWHTPSGRHPPTRRARSGARATEPHSPRESYATFGRRSDSTAGRSRAGADRTVAKGEGEGRRAVGGRRKEEGGGAGRRGCGAGRAAGRGDELLANGLTCLRPPAHEPAHLIGPAKACQGSNARIRARNEKR
jgi:hypothetical protein